MLTNLYLPAAFVFSFLGTWLIIVLSRRQQWLELPNSRSSHTDPTPSCGGVAIVTVFVVTAALALKDSNPGFNLVLLLLLCTCIAAMGLLDDIYQLGIRARISTQFLVVAGALALFGIPAIPLFNFTLQESWPVYLLVTMAFLWFINLFNFMDGIDGLGATEVIFICTAVIIITFADSTLEFRLLLLILLASVSGFLLLNFAPARIFMGDIGSNFLGYILGLAGLISTTMGITNIWVWSILAGVFIVDASSTLVSRMLTGETWYYAHRTHAYQLASAHYNSHGKVVIGVTLLNCFWLLPIAWIAHYQPVWGLSLTVIAWLPLFIIVRLARKLK